MNAYSPVTNELPGVLQDITRERQHQISKGYTSAHDDQHTIHQMVRFSNEQITRPGTNGEGFYSRERLVKAAAVLVAAVEAWDRREAQR